MRVGMAQPCPAWVQTAKPSMAADGRSASSRTMVADFPPSSRKRRFMVAAPFSMIRLPTAVEPVKEMQSTCGERVSSSPTRWSDAVTTLKTPGGMSVCSATTFPMRVACQGVSGAGLSTMVLPVASAWATFTIETSNGKFQGVIAPTTPTGTFRIRRDVRPPLIGSSVSGRWVSHSKRSIMPAAQGTAWASGSDIWGPPSTSMRGAPTSWISSSRSSSATASSPDWSCSRQRRRKAWFVDQSVSSKARRAAAMARCISAAEPSATSPRTSSVAGLTFSNLAPESASTSSPSMSILVSGSMVGRSATVVSRRSAAWAPLGGRLVRRSPGQASGRGTMATVGMVAEGPQRTTASTTRTSSSTSMSVPVR